MGSVHLAKALAQWVIAAGNLDQDKYEEMVWNKTKDVMKDFVDYMESDDIIPYAANCDNKGWEHYAHENGAKLVTQKVGDRIVCVLMVGALYFMNGWHRAEQVRTKEEAITENIREHLRCIIVHMFSEVLNESVCKSTWGTYYAWHTVKEMEHGTGGVSGGLIQQRKCGRDLVAHGNIGGLRLNAAVKEWLQANSTLQQRLQNVKGTNTCQTKWQKGWKIADFLNNENMEHKDTLGITEIVKGLKEGMTDIFREIRKQVEQDVKKRQHAKNRKSATDGKNGQAASEAATPSKDTSADKAKKDQDQGSTTSSDTASGTPGQESVGTTDTTPAGVASVGRNDPTTSATTSSTSAPTTSTRSVPTTSTTTQTTSSTSPESKGKGTTCTASTTSASTHGAAITLNFGCTSDQELGVPPSTLLRPTDAAPGTEAGATNNTKDHTTPAAAPAAEPAQGAGPEPPGPPREPSAGTKDKSTAQPSGADSNIQMPVVAKPGPTGPEGRGGGTPTNSDDAVFGPWSKSNNSIYLWTIETAPSDSGGSSGRSASPDGHPQGGAQDGKPGSPSNHYYGVPCTTKDGNPDCDLKLAVPFEPTTNLSDGHFGPGATPAIRDLHHDGVGKEDVPLDIPDLTDTVLTATTPVLFFLSAVIVAVLGYSLWKYFAHVAKRRRTYRTVRDVPSPPLDEDIWQHLQRDEPPPAYGYTMIVVQEFARDLERDPIMCSRILDVPTSHAALATHDSTTLHPPTDCAGTDPCPPNEDDPDPWNCMETTQLATDPSASNADDPDPWSCMESIQLDAEQRRAHSNPEHAPSYCTHWINWIEEHKHILRECTTQPWFLQLTLEWKQFLREHMVANEASAAHRKAASMETQKLHAWKDWVAQQHRQMSMYGQEAWFPRLLHTVQEEKVSDNGAVPRVEKHLEVENVMAAEDVLRVRHAQPSQLHKHTYMKKPLTAKIWILILALIIEECELESRLQEKELYVDNLLEHL
ncbi:hypothetical protein AK88_05258 [Plasmodium fragile]|uniref:Schizont-infected cell agglutination C-terminal domain-containing protein n=1 Tax=Plasmodium fragile TaxID=5857 RepID=A0A0D9QHD2_PLAFR|nr:uncharacterized protein AK88_05258 [Plasmodium fragile]KJP85106.1 hypothetical protein AK88_05258 [Plasmodium fragile]